MSCNDLAQPMRQAVAALFLCMLFWVTLADKAGDAVPDSRQVKTSGTNYENHLPGSAVPPTLLLAGLVQARFAPGTCSSTRHTGSEPALRNYSKVRNGLTQV
jgi:hypothetical protein